MNFGKFWRFVCIVSSLALLLTTGTGNVFANSKELPSDTKNVDQSSSHEKNKSIEIEIVTVDPNLSKEEISRLALENVNATKNTNDVSIQSTTGGYRIYRSGDTTTCQLSIYYLGDILLQSWRFKSITVKSNSLIFPTTYATFGNGSSYTYLSNVASTAAVVYVGSMSIPTDVTRVTISQSDLQAYSMNSASWLSVGQFGGGVDIY